MRREGGKEEISKWEIVRREWDVSRVGMGAGRGMGAGQGRSKAGNGGAGHSC